MLVEGIVPPSEREKKIFGARRVSREGRNRMDIWGRMAPRYDAFIRRFVTEQYSEIVYKTWNSFAEDKSLIEIGAGTGAISLEIARKVKKITVTDISERMLDIAKQKALTRGVENADFVVADGGDLPFAAEQFDGCLIINVLHVIKDPLACLKEARRLLKPDGLLIVSTFCHGEGIKEKLISTAMSLATGIVFRKLTMADITHAVETAGFYVVEKQRMEGAIPLLFLAATPYQQKKS